MQDMLPDRPIMNEPSFIIGQKLHLARWVVKEIFRKSSKPRVCLKMSFIGIAPDFEADSFARLVPNRRRKEGYADDFAIEGRPKQSRARRDGRERKGFIGGQAA